MDVPDEVELYDDLPDGNLAMKVVWTKRQLKVWRDVRRERGSVVERYF